MIPFYPAVRDQALREIRLHDVDRELDLGAVIVEVVHLIDERIKPLVHVLLILIHKVVAPAERISGYRNAQSARLPDIHTVCEYQAGRAVAHEIRFLRALRRKIGRVIVVTVQAYMIEDTDFSVRRWCVHILYLLIRDNDVVGLTVDRISRGRADECICSSIKRDRRTIYGHGIEVLFTFKG